MFGPVTAPDGGAHNVVNAIARARGTSPKRASFLSMRIPLQCLFGLTGLTHWRDTHNLIGQSAHGSVVSRGMSNESHQQGGKITRRRTDVSLVRPLSWATKGRGPGRRGRLDVDDARPAAAARRSARRPRGTGARHR